jgi:type IV secretory pathway VirB2 component (pilin)
MSAQLMQSGWGKAILVVIGLVVICIGGYHVYKGVAMKFEKDLKATPGRGVTALGVGGYTAKGLVFIGAGVLVLVATLRSDPSKATGIDGAVKTLGEAPFGKFLLILAALGIAAFGIYSFVRSRYARM